MDLSVEYLAGGSIDRLARLIKGRKIDGWKEDGSELYLKEHLRRFSILASMVAGKEMRVVVITGDAHPRPYLPLLTKLSHPALLSEHGFGWSDGETIHLPVSLVDMPGVESQGELARLLVFFLAAQAAHGSLEVARAHHSTLSTDQLLADLYWVYENERLANVLNKEFPAVLSGWGRMVEHLMGRRPHHRMLTPAERRVEALLEEATTRAPLAEASLKSATESLVKARETRAGFINAGVPIKRYRAILPFAPWGRLVPGRLDKPKRMSTVKKGGGENEKNPQPVKEQESKDNPARNRYMTRREEVDKEENEGGLALNIYDKFLSWAQFVNVTRPFDDEPDDEASKKADDLEELTTAEVERTTSAFFDAELEGTDTNDDTTNEEDEPTVGRDSPGVVVESYPEWDYKTMRYREGHATVKESVPDGSDDSTVWKILDEKGPLVKEVKRSFESLAPSARLIRRLYDGDEVDIDAAVEAAADLRCGKCPDERLYMAKRKSEKDISVLFLVDMSMSTDSWVANSRVIDHEKEALVILCEAMEATKDKYSVYGFSGKSRKNVRAFRIKGFCEDYGKEVRGRLGGLIPYHYTRMGAAIRHASKILAAEPSKLKLLFILSDGKPNDVDIYEGRYGMEDTRMAIKETEGDGVVPFCLTVDTEAAGYLPKLFGRGNYATLSSAYKLASTLPTLYARLVKNL